jgi:hypothetical protein
MDLQLYLRVLWRFRILVVLGLLLAMLLSFLSYARVSFSEGAPHISYRQPELWYSDSELLITQRGFPWGRTGGVDTSPLTGLAITYSQFAESDVVEQIMLRDGPVPGIVDASVVYDSQLREALPAVVIAGIAPSPKGAVETARRATKALLEYLSQEQIANHIPPSERVVAQQLKTPLVPVLQAPRKRTRPIMIFLAVTTAFIVLVFVLENLRPRVRPVSREEIHSITPDVSRKSA